MLLSHRLAFFAVLALSVNLASAQVNTTLLGQRSYSNNLNDIWGYADGATEYALVGVTNGSGQTPYWRRPSCACLRAS